MKSFIQPIPFSWPHKSNSAILLQFFSQLGLVPAVSYTSSFLASTLFSSSLKILRSTGVSIANGEAIKGLPSKIIL